MTRAASNPVAAETAADLPAGARARCGAVGAIIELGKPRLVQLVTITAALGFALGAIAVDPATVGGTAGLTIRALACLFGVTLAAAGANALNQAWEAPRDARMGRTRHRPVPSGRLTRTTAWIAGLVMSVAGCGALWLFTTPGATVLTAFTIASYVLIYTPLKPITEFNTWVGTLPGALPPVIGWAAAMPEPWAVFQPGDDMWAAWGLAALMAVWQLPHFAAIAWKFREDYARGGYKMLSVVDPSGRRTSRCAVIWSGVLLPVSLLPAAFLHDRLTGIFVVGAVLAGIWMFRWSVEFAEKRTDELARKVFFASLVYLPLAILSLVIDAGVAALLG
jgi:protoheme IX farnesyltransferase